MEIDNLRLFIEIGRVSTLSIITKLINNEVNVTRGRSRIATPSPSHSIFGSPRKFQMGPTFDLQYPSLRS